MKMITAIIPSDKLDQVREALIAAEIGRITVSRVTGHGQQENMDLYRGQEVAPQRAERLGDPGVLLGRVAPEVLVGVEAHGATGYLGPPRPEGPPGASARAPVSPPQE